MAVWILLMVLGWGLLIGGWTFTDLGTIDALWTSSAATAVFVIAVVYSVVRRRT